MAEVIIRLEIDPTTGKKNIIVKLRSDDSLLPLEHEQMHRQLVDKILEGGLAKADELGDLVIERENEEEAPSEVPEEQAPAQRQSQAEGQ